MSEGRKLHVSNVVTPQQVELREDVNSHVARIVHPWDWPHAAAVRKRWAASVAGLTAAYRYVRMSVGSAMHVTLQRVWCTCDRCPRRQGEGQWCLWLPEGYDVRTCDVGPCPNCDKWCAPHAVEHTDGRTWDLAALRIGETVAWHELSDRSLCEVAAFESWREHYYKTRSTYFLKSVMIAASQRDLGFALTEARYRGLLLAPDELRVACDLAQTQGALVAGEPERLTLVELWARCLPYAHNR